MSSDKQQIERCVVINNPSNIVYSTTTSNEKQEQGKFNFGHTIAELECDNSANGSYKLSVNQVDQNNTLPSNPTSSTTSRNFFLGIIQKMGIKAFFLDVAVCLLLLLFIVLVETAIVPSFKRGFTCGDPSISFKFTGDTITTGLIMASILLIIVPIWVSEGIKLRKIGNRKILWQESMYKTIYWYNRFLLGVALHLGFVEAMKTILGECRPHFLDTCRPDTGFNCTVGTYVSEFTCTNMEDSPGFVSDSYRSFPSGHSSLGFYEAVFVSWYLQRRFPSSRSKWLIALLQSLFFAWGATCALTRITDNRHNWWDVLIGSVIGIIAAVYICVVICHNFRTPSSTSYINDTEDNLDSSITQLKSEKQMMRITIPERIDEVHQP